MQSVCVLMSTYNGEKYLEEQLLTILKQKDVIVRLVIRDDGSTDKTKEIIQKYRDEIYDIVYGENIGCEKSFMELMHSEYEDDYYAFADQDDIWDIDKLICGIKKIEKYDSPALYGCNLREYRDDRITGRLIFSEEKMQRIRSNFQRSYLYSVHGCTLIWNKKLDNILKRYKPCAQVGHDVWLCTIANALGHAEYDDEAHISYRIHENNTSGYAKNTRERMFKAIKRYFIKGQKLYCFASEFLKGYGELLDKSTEEYCHMYNLSRYHNSMKSKRWLLRSKYIKDKPIFERLFWKICIWFNRY